MKQKLVLHYKKKIEVVLRKLLECANIIISIRLVIVWNTEPLAVHNLITLYKFSSAESYTVCII
jgi:hypothetical protein